MMGGEFLHNRLIKAGTSDAVSNMLMGAAVGATADVGLGVVNGDFNVVGNAASGAMLGAAGGAGARHFGKDYVDGLEHMAKSGEYAKSFKVGAFSEAAKADKTMTQDFMGTNGNFGRFNREAYDKAGGFDKPKPPGSGANNTNTSAPPEGAGSNNATARRSSSTSNMPAQDKNASNIVGNRVDNTPTSIKQNPENVAPRTQKDTRIKMRAEAIGQQQQKLNKHLERQGGTNQPQRRELSLEEKAQQIKNRASPESREKAEANVLRRQHLTEAIKGYKPEFNMHNFPNNAVTVNSGFNGNVTAPFAKRNVSADVQNNMQPRQQHIFGGDN